MPVLFICLHFFDDFLDQLSLPKVFTKYFSPQGKPF